MMPEVTPPPEIVQIVNEVDLTPVLEQLAAMTELQVSLTVAVLVLCGVVLGCAISLILAVMFK